MLFIYRQVWANKSFTFELETLPKRYQLELNIFGIPEMASR